MNICNDLDAEVSVQKAPAMNGGWFEGRENRMTFLAKIILSVVVMGVSLALVFLWPGAIWVACAES